MSRGRRAIFRHLIDALARWGIVLMPIGIVLGCSSTGPSAPPVVGCASGMDVTDAAACWIWSDSIERTKPVANDTHMHPLLIGPDGKPIMTPQAMSP